MKSKKKLVYKFHQNMQQNPYKYVQELSFRNVGVNSYDFNKLKAIKALSQNYKNLPLKIRQTRHQMINQIIQGQNLYNNSNNSNNRHTEYKTKNDIKYGYEKYFELISNKQQQQQLKKYTSITLPQIKSYNQQQQNIFQFNKLRNQLPFSTKSLYLIQNKLISQKINLQNQIIKSPRITNGYVKSILHLPKMKRSKSQVIPVDKWKQKYFKGQKPSQLLTIRNKNFIKKKQQIHKIIQNNIKKGKISSNKFSQDINELQPKYSLRIKQHNQQDYQHQQPQQQQNLFFQHQSDQTLNQNPQKRRKNRYFIQQNQHDLNQNHSSQGINFLKSRFKSISMSTLKSNIHEQNKDSNQFKHTKDKLFQKIITQNLFENNQQTIPNINNSKEQKIKKLDQKIVIKSKILSNFAQRCQSIQFNQVVQGIRSQSLYQKQRNHIFTQIIQGKPQQWDTKIKNSYKNIKDDQDFQVFVHNQITD